MVQFFQWEEHDIVIGARQTFYKGNSWDHSSEFLNYNSINNLHMLWKYLHHLVNQAKESTTHDNPYSFMDPEGFHQISRKQFMQW